MFLTVYVSCALVADVFVVPGKDVVAGESPYIFWFAVSSTMLGLVFTTYELVLELKENF